MCVYSLGCTRLFTGKPDTAHSSSSSSSGDVLFGSECMYEERPSDRVNRSSVQTDTADRNAGDGRRAIGGPQSRDSALLYMIYHGFRPVCQQIYTPAETVMPYCL